MVPHRLFSRMHSTAGTVVASGDALIVSGRIEEVQRFADLT
ncbi:hypothetical protein [Nocardia sp. NPDC003345]